MGHRGSDCPPPETSPLPSLRLRRARVQQPRQSHIALELFIHGFGIGNRFVGESRQFVDESSSKSRIFSSKSVVFLDESSSKSRFFSRPRDADVGGRRGGGGFKKNDLQSGRGGTYFLFSLSFSQIVMAKTVCLVTIMMATATLVASLMAILIHIMMASLMASLMVYFLPFLGAIFFFSRHSKDSFSHPTPVPPRKNAHTSNTCATTKKCAYIQHLCHHIKIRVQKSRQEKRASQCDCGTDISPILIYVPSPLGEGPKQHWRPSYPSWPFHIKKNERWRPSYPSWPGVHHILRGLYPKKMSAGAHHILRGLFNQANVAFERLRWEKWRGKMGEEKWWGKMGEEKWARKKTAGKNGWGKMERKNARGKMVGKNG